MIQKKYDHYMHFLETPIKLLVAGLLLFSLLSCNAKKNGPPVVLSTIGMIHNMVQEIGGDRIHAVALMGPGIDPHLYKASAGDIKILNNADLILYNGLHLESKLIGIFEAMGKTKPTRAVTATIPKHQLIQPAEYDGFYDPHVWFDVSLWKLAATQVHDALVELDQKNQAFYTKKHTEYQKKLTALDDWIQREINAIPTKNRVLVTAHDAFGYFGKKYNINVVGLQGISTASEVGTTDIQNVTRLIIDNSVPTIFIESSVPVRQIQALKDAVAAKGWQVDIGDTLFTDAMGDAGTEKGTYIGMMKHNVLSIVNGLKK
jgi:manganese/zinc/iron transport system substrate-binding protein